MTSWLILVAAIVLEVFATSVLNMSEGFRKIGPTIVALTGYSASFFLLSRALQVIPLGVAYAVWSGLGVVFIVMIGALIFRQHVSITGYIGITLILIGTLVTYLSGDIQE